MEKTTFIYALCEPNSRTVRYIGKANDPSFRFKKHMCKSSKAKTHLGNWLRSVLSIGEAPALVILREVPKDEWQAAERRYIRLARGLGMKLVNCSDGGDGVTFTPEVRAKISASRAGVRLGKGHCAAIAASHTGLKRSPEQCANISASLKGKMPSAATQAAARTLETRAKISASKTGKKIGPPTLLHRANVSRALSGVPKTPEHNAKNSAAQKLIWAARKAAQT